MRENYRKYNQLRKLVNNSIGILPFMWMIILFVEISGGITEVNIYFINLQVIYNLIHYNSSLQVIIHANNYHTFAYVYIFYEIASFGALVFCVCYLCDRTHQRLSNSLLSGVRHIESEVAALHDRYWVDHDANCLLLEMSVDPLVPATGWGVFSLNKHLIISFLGSVVPFSGIYIQIIIINLFTNLHNYSYGHYWNFANARRTLKPMNFI